jgi:hypothetical protein
MKIGIACIHWPVASGRYAADAFKRLGCDVRTFGYSSGTVIWGTTVDDRYVWKPNGDLTTSWDDWKPDIMILMDSAWAYHHPVYADTPHIVWGVDNHVKDYRQPGVVRYFLGHRAVSLMPMDAPDTEWLPCGYDPQWFSPSPIPWAERKWDVAMIGVMYPRRMELVQALGDAGLNVVAGTGPIYEQYRDIYWDTRISLCVSAAGDVAQRVFETAAMGCYILSDPLPDLIELELGVSVEIFTTPEEAVKKAKGILKSVKNHEVFNFSEHSWDARARRIMDWHAAEYGKAARHGDA